MDARSMLLGFLMDGSKTGYELRKRFSLSFSFFSGLSYGSIYPALKKMEKQGLVSMRVEIQDGAPNRKIYTITEAGTEAFVEALRAPFDLERPKSTFLTRLFFFSHLSPEERQATAARHLESIQQVRRRLQAIEPDVKGRADKHQYLCYRFGLRFFEDLGRNVSDIVRELESDAGKGNARFSVARRRGSRRKAIP
jgi:DNA-binding PadR family transcriptional regulator